MSKAKIFNFLVNAFLMIMALSMILVFVVLIIGSFKPNSDLLKIPDETSYNAYLERARKAPKYELFAYSGIVWTDPGIYAIASSIFTGESTPGSIVDKLYGSLNSALTDQWNGASITG